MTRHLVAQWGPGGGRPAVAWLDARTLVVAGRDVLVVDAATGLVRGRVETDDFDVTTLVARDGHVLASRRLWSLERDEVHEIPDGDADLLDGGRVVVARDGSLVVIDASGTRELGECRARPHAQPGGDRVACGAQLVSARDASERRALPDGAVDSFTPDGSSVLLYEGGTLIVVDAATGAERYRVDLPGDDPYCGSSRSFAGSRDGTTLAVTCSGAGAALVLDARSGRERARVAVPNDVQLALSSDGSALALGTYHETTVVDVASGAVLRRAPGEVSVAFAPEGAVLAIASARGIEIVDGAGGPPVATPIAGGPPSAADDQIGSSADPDSAVLVRAVLGGFVRIVVDADPLEIRACGAAYAAGVGGRVVDAERGLWTGGDTCVALPGPQLARTADLAWVVGGAPVVRVGVDGTRVAIAPRASSASISDDGARVLVATERELTLHDGATGARLARRALARTTGVALSRRGGLAVQRDERRVAWLDARLRTLREVPLGSGAAVEVAFAPDDTAFLELVPARTLTVVRASAPERPETIALDGYEPDYGARAWFSTDASRIAVVHDLPSERQRVEIRGSADPRVVIASFEGTAPVFSRDLRIAAICRDGRLTRIEVDTGATTELGACAARSVALVAGGRALWIDGHTLLRAAGTRARITPLLGGPRAIVVWRDDAGRWDAQGAPADASVFAVRTGRSVTRGSIERTDEGRVPGLGAQLVAP